MKNFKENYKFIGGHKKLRNIFSPDYINDGLFRWEFIEKLLQHFIIPDNLFSDLDLFERWLEKFNYLNLYVIFLHIISGGNIKVLEYFLDETEFESLNLVQTNVLLFPAKFNKFDMILYLCKRFDIKQENSKAIIETIKNNNFHLFVKLCNLRFDRRDCFSTCLIYKRPRFFYYLYETSKYSYMPDNIKFYMDNMEIFSSERRQIKLAAIKMGRLDVLKKCIDWIDRDREILDYAQIAGHNHILEYIYNLNKNKFLSNIDIAYSIFGGKFKTFKWVFDTLVKNDALSDDVVSFIFYAFELKTVNNSDLQNSFKYYPRKFYPYKCFKKVMNYIINFEDVKTILLSTSILNTNPKTVYYLEALKKRHVTLLQSHFKKISDNIVNCVIIPYLIK